MGDRAMIRDLPRQTLLYIVAGAAVGLLALDNLVIEPAFHAWSAQGERIEALQKKVVRGRSLLARETIIRTRWAEMQRANLPGDDSAAESEAVNAMARWKLASKIGLPSLTPSRQTHDDLGYDAFEYRISATGNQIELGQFIYELETDGLPVNLEECEIAARDPKGQTLTLTARFSFARLSADTGAGNNGGANGNNPSAPGRTAR